MAITTVLLWTNLRSMSASPGKCDNTGCFIPRAAKRSLEPVSVITSYSIHYTKLYEMSGSKVHRETRMVGKPFPYLWMLVRAVVVRNDMDVQMGSYNFV